MATLARPLRGIGPYWLIVWAAILVLAAYFVTDSLISAATEKPQPGTTFLNRQLWYFAHMATAIPILVIAPVQFIAAIRQARPAVHRWLGRLFLGASIAAGALAVWLGATIQYQGSRIPLVLFGLVWIGFSVSAWRCARRRDFANHRRFVIRSFAIGLAFVWVRALGFYEAELLGFIDNGEVRDTTLEFLSFVIPVLVVEAWLSWVPAARAR